MNIEYIKYCIRSVKRRWKSILRTSLAIFFAFVFVAGVMLFKSNMYQWQLQSVRHRFGSWIIMLYDSNLEENSELKNHLHFELVINGVYVNPEKYYTKTVGEF